MKGVFGNDGALRFLFQDVVETSEEMRNGFFSFVAHVGQAKGFAAEFAVAGIDEQVMLLAQFFGEREHVDAFIVGHARQGL